MYINQCITYRGGIDGENGYAREKHAFAPAGRIGKRIRGDTEPPNGKRVEEGGEKPIGRIGKRGEERELSLPAHRKEDAGRQAVTLRPAKPNRGAARRIE